ncbi:hypothetical protein JD969_11530 [Planctomycetota bacterium]|nr:hypothetical protein JD969_11530 [Planctomycetota bacterium]
MTSHLAKTLLLLIGLVAGANAQASFMTLDELYLDFDTDGFGASIGAGQVIDDEYVTLGTWVDVTNHNKALDQGMAFDTSNPVGDPDLANPGYGVGNTASNLLGNVLVVAADGGSVPNDEEAVNVGMTYSSYVDFYFTETYLQGTVDLLDIEGAAASVLHGARLDLIDDSSVVMSYEVASLGDNGLQTFAFGGVEFDSIRINLTRGGGIDNLHLFTVPEPGALTLLTLGALVFTTRPKRQA